MAVAEIRRLLLGKGGPDRVVGDGAQRGEVAGVELDGQVVLVNRPRRTQLLLEALEGIPCVGCRVDL